MQLGPAREPHDLLLLDPPYGSGAGPVALDRLVRLGWIGPASWITLETGRTEDVRVKSLVIESERVVGAAKRTLLRLDPRLAPVKAAVLPLSRHADLSPVARDLAASLRKTWNVEFDDAGQIGRRYRRQDEIGTPFCLTVDFETAADQAVTIRDRDSMAQERVALDQVQAYLAARLIGA